MSRELKVCEPDLDRVRGLVLFGFGFGFGLVVAIRLANRTLEGWMYVTVKNLSVTPPCRFSGSSPATFTPAATSAGFCSCMMANARLHEEHDVQKAKCSLKEAELFYIIAMYRLGIFA